MSSVRFVTYVLGSYPLYPPPAIALYFRWCIPEAGGGNLFGTLDQGLRSRWSLTPGYFHFGPPGLLQRSACPRLATPPFNVEFNAKRSAPVNQCRSSDERLNEQAGKAHENGAIHEGSAAEYHTRAIARPSG